MVTTFNAEQIRNAYAYWTPERRKAAIPVSPDPLPGQAPINHFALSEPFRPDALLYPYRCCGKVYHKRDGRDYVASGQFVSHCHMVLTAAHVIRDRDTGKYADLVLFVRAEGSTESQVVVVEHMGTRDDWVGAPHEEQAARIDYGWCFTDQPSEAGYLIFQTGDPQQQMQGVGYPLNYENGEYLYAVDGSRGSVLNGYMEMVGNPFTHGASGGAWLANVDPGNCMDPLANLVVGIHSRFLTQSDSPIYLSPVFDAATTDLYAEVLAMGEGHDDCVSKCQGDMPLDASPMHHFGS